MLPTTFKDAVIPGNYFYFRYAGWIWDGNCDDRTFYILGINNLETVTGAFK